MSNLLYWVIPCVIVAIVGIGLTLREKRPAAPEASVNAFARSMHAISPMSHHHTSGERKQAV